MFLSSSVAPDAAVIHDHSMAQLIRDAQPDDVDDIAKMWHLGWHAAHADIVPKALTQLRTRDSFDSRTAKHLPRTRVIEQGNRLAGFCMIRNDELYQLYVGPAGQGKGLAGALIADAEAKLAAKGHGQIWLSCAIGNARAERFYAKSGWVLQGQVIDKLETQEGTFDLAVLRFEKALGGA